MYIWIKFHNRKTGVWEFNDSDSEGWDIDGLTLSGIGIIFYNGLKGKQLLLMRCIMSFRIRIM